MKNISEKLNKICDLAGFVFIASAVMYVVFLWWNTLSDYVIDEEYFNSKYFLIIGLIAGIIWIFKPTKQNDKKRDN